MIKKIQFSEDSSYFRNDLTATQENQTRRNSYSVPTKRPVIKQIFDFYTKQSYVIGVNATFDRQNLESNDFTLAKFYRFCQDFKISFLNKKELKEIFIRCATNKFHMNFQEFEKLISILAYYRGLNLHQFYEELGLNSWHKNQQKMKMFGKPFHMKDDTERFKKEDLHYQFELYHPDIKDKELISDILQQRKINQQLMKLQQKEKKEEQKLQFELKFLSGMELLEKYPEKEDMIKKISNKKNSKHIYYFKSLKKNRYSTKPIQQFKQIIQPPLITWKDVENFQVDERLISSMLEPTDTEDQFLQNYNIDIMEKSQVKNSYQEYGKIVQSVKVRSLSDQKQACKKQQLHNSTQQQNERYHQNVRSPLEEQNLEKSQTERQHCPSINLTQSKSPQKLNISILRRANEIQNLEEIKQKSLLEKILQRRNF